MCLYELGSSLDELYREYNPDGAGTRRDECLVETHLDRSLVGEQKGKQLVVKIKQGGFREKPTEGERTR